MMLKDCPLLFSLVESFIEKECNFKSSAKLKSIMEKIGERTTIDEVFTTPIEYYALQFDKSIMWAFFLSKVVTSEMGDEDKAFLEACPFNVEQAFGIISDVYDVGVSEFYEQYAGEDDDDEGDDEDEDGGD